MDMSFGGALDVLKKMAGIAGQPEHREPGPGEVGPSVDTKADQGPSDAESIKKRLVTLPFDDELMDLFWREIERAKDRRNHREEKWDILLREYLPIVEASNTAESVKVNRHFRDVHSKMGQLFFTSPELVLEEDEPSPAQDPMPNPANPQGPPLTKDNIIEVKKQVLNKKMGRDGIKANRLMDELLFDVLAWTPYGCCKVGYQCFFKTPPAPPAQVQQPGDVLGINSVTPPPPPAPEPVPIFEEWYARRVSPKKALMSADLYSTRVEEDATWVGQEFFMSPRQAMKKFGLTEDEASKAAEDDRRHMYDEDKQGGSPTALVHGYELWPKLSYFTDEPHPQAIGQLILIEGIKDRPIVWRPSPDQQFDDMGRLTDDSLVGFPLKFLYLRDLADSAFPPSDAAFQNSGIKQLSTWRRQSVKMRDAAIAKILYDQDAFDKDEANILKNAELGTYVGVIGGKMAQGIDKILGPAYQPHAAQDDYRAAEIQSRDLDETLGIGSNQSGSPTDTVRTATETSTVNQAIAARNKKERDRVIDFYLDVARAVDQLLMRYATENTYIQIAGQAGAKIMAMWNGQLISGKYTYDIAPDSQMQVDSEADFRLDVEYYNQTAKDPLSNRAYVLKRMARKRGMDPNKAVNDPATLAQPKPIPPTISFAFKGPDLADPTVMEILQRAELLGPTEPGTGGAPPAAGAPVQQPPHGGQATGAEVVNQHSASNSGKRPNEPGATNHRESQVK